MSEELETKGETGQEAVTSAIIEEPHVSAVIEDRVFKGTADKPVTTEMLVQTLKRIESQVRKSYPDPTRITVPAANPHHLVIHQDFRRDVDPIPHHVRSPQVALVNGKPLQVSSYTLPEVRSRNGVVIQSASVVPIYAAADANGKPWKDARGEYVVIDPQNGQIRQNMKPKSLAKRAGRSWLRVKIIRLKQWWKSIRFDFKFIKRV